jgi:hypothetical protein
VHFDPSGEHRPENKVNGVQDVNHTTLAVLSSGCSLRQASGFCDPSSSPCGSVRPEGLLGFLAQAGSFSLMVLNFLLFAIISAITYAKGKIAAVSSDRFPTARNEHFSGGSNHERFLK